MKKLLLILLPLLFVVTACNNDDRLETDDVASGAKIVGFEQSVFNYAYFEDEGGVEDVIPVNLIGLGNGQLPSAPITINYEIIADETTAVEGEEYTLGASGSIQIPAGAEFGKIPITINTGSLNPSAPTQLTLKLTSSSDGVIAYRKEIAIIQFVGCKTELEGTYTSYFSGSEISAHPATITKVAPNKYRASYLPAFSAEYWIEFTDVCGTLQMTDWQYQGGNPITDPNTGALPAGYVEGDQLVFEHVKVDGVGWFADEEVRYVRQ